MKLSVTAGLFAALLLTPLAASASFSQSAEQARSEVSALTQQQLDSLNSKVFTDAFIAAEVIGFDRREIDQLKADVQTLKTDNAQLRAQLNSPGVPPSGASSNIEARIAVLEDSFASLQRTLGTVGECTIRIDKTFDYDGNDLKEGNDVQLFVADADVAEGEALSDGFGVRLIYRGYISLIERVVNASTEGPIVHLVGYYTLLSMDVLKDGAQTTLYSHNTTGLPDEDIMRGCG